MSTPDKTDDRVDTRVMLVLAAMMLLLPAVGVPSELLLQDTLKSALVAFGTLGAALLLCGSRLRTPGPLAWHPLLWLPLMLLAWALGSMAWSHTYLAGVEAVRWFLFALLLWLGLQVLSPSNLPGLAQAIHWGAVMAALWASLQFWDGLRLFPQAAPPASTFSNRNFFAEYLVCSLPYSIWLAAQGRGTAQILLRASTVTMIMLAILMTGTRSALLALAVLLPVLLLLLYRLRSHLAWPQWRLAQQAGCVLTAVLLLLGAGSIPTRDATMLRESPAQTVLERSLQRVEQSATRQEYEPTGSVGTRLMMWQANARMVLAHPWAGVGAGAWEVEIPRFQAEGQEIEEDYYAHNEPLQLVAEYGLIGWVFLLALAAYLLRAAWLTWRLHDSPEAPWRATALASLLGLMIVSLAGFPWRLAGTGALFAIGLSVLAGSDLRLAWRSQEDHRLSARWIWLVGCATAALLLLPAAWISYQAYASESRLVRAAQIAYQISLSGRHNDPAWNSHKAEMLQLLREGVAIHPHYRKLTALAADELVRWGDWDNARWVLESMAASRPHVVVILTNLGRLHARAAEMDRAQDYLRRARSLQAQGPAVQSLQLLLLRQAGQEDEAVALVREVLSRGSADLDLLNQAYQLAVQRQDWPLAIEVLNRRLQHWPVTAVESWLRLAQIYALPAIGDEARALQAYRSALELLPDEQREPLRRQIPLPYRKRL